MRAPPPQPDCWSPTDESIYKSPKHFNERVRHQSQHPQSYNDVRPTHHNQLSPTTQNAASSVPMFGHYWPLHDLVLDDMTVPKGPASTSAAPQTHSQYVDYSHMHHPHDRLHIHYSVAPPPHFEPASVAAYAPQPIPPKPTSQPEQPKQSLLESKTMLEKMRHERELVFENAATELERAKCDNGSFVAFNKAWEDAWATLRERMTKM
ncbi:hypothetical protein KCU65_g2136, partial [Aureobasidium melanogenum]